MIVRLRAGHNDEQYINEIIQLEEGRGKIAFICVIYVCLLTREKVFVFCFSILS